jgi:uncharacterized protein (TIGR03086 family)
VVSLSHTPVGLLERSLDYALAAVGAVEPSMLHRQTPCREWDLRELLCHLTDSMRTLNDLLGGSVGEVGGFGPVMTATDAARDLRRAITFLDIDIDDSMATIGGLPMPRHLVVLTGALEIAIHAWDVGQVCECARPMPAQLAQDLLRRAPLLLEPTDRRDLFAAPIEPALGASAAERLVAFAGRASRPVASPAGAQREWHARALGAETRPARVDHANADGSSRRPGGVGLHTVAAGEAIWGPWRADSRR